MIIYVFLDCFSVLIMCHEWVESIEKQLYSRSTLEWILANTVPVRNLCRFQWLLHQKSCQRSQTGTCDFERTWERN